MVFRQPLWNSLPTASVKRSTAVQSVLRCKPASLLGSDCVGRAGGSEDNDVQLFEQKRCVKLEQRWEQQPSCGQGVQIIRASEVLEERSCLTVMNNDTNMRRTKT